MPMKTIENINLIYRDSKIRGGRPCIVGTSLRVTDIVMQQKYGDGAPEKNRRAISDYLGASLCRFGLLSRTQRGNRC